MIDLRVIRSTVDLIFKTIVPTSLSEVFRENEVITDSLKGRHDYIDRKDDEFLREGMTTVVGAIMNKQRCWERTACALGRMSQKVAAKEVVFM